jgi:hypothetical protein
MSKNEVSEPSFRVVFMQQGEVYEIYARYLYQSDLYGFIEVEELLFGERSQLVVDPGEEKLKATFVDVKRSFIPLHTILRIDEVNKEGKPAVTRSTGSNVSFLPGAGLPPCPDN